MKDVVAKLLKLRALAGNNPEEHEREAAKGMLAKKLEEHGLTEADLDAAERGATPAPVQVPPQPVWGFGGVVFVVQWGWCGGVTTGTSTNYTTSSSTFDWC